MKQYGLNELREMFLSFFEEKEHLRLPGFSLVPHGDASLLLINSGMAPMKTWFTGQQDPPAKRVCTCQKCIRTGDIDSVGKTSRHGTYFEMLGNFSFGDYFKRDAIIWCWEFLTERVGIDPNLLYPSVYHDDEDAFEIWRDVVGIAPERIVRLGKEDNFWDHGSGPCGPCSEVYFDRGAAHGCENPNCSPGCSCDRYVEVWNNVFTQFDNDGSGNYSELAQKNIDTGMGLERLACICQGVDNIFEVDTVKSIVDKVSEICGVPYGAGASSDVSIRIIADHMRAATMMICDGILPSNEGRGHVLRRLLRRAARQGRLLGVKELFLGDVCDTVIAENKGAYPDLGEKAAFIKRVVRTEEENFGKTIDAGIAMLDGFADNLRKSGETTLSGVDAFKLYDTFGFPLDLTVDILAERGMTVDAEDFEKKMAEQRERARKARESLGDLAWERIDLGLDNTPTQFVGFSKHSAEATILAIVAEGELSSALREGEDGYIVLDKTPFYAELGGQSADVGTFSGSGGDGLSRSARPTSGGDGASGMPRPTSGGGSSSSSGEGSGSGSASGNAVFDVSDVQLSKAGKYLHHGKMRSGTLSVGDIVTASIDVSRRSAIMRAHSATHLLHKALQTVLGEHTKQAGSLVDADTLRFDFTHIEAMTKEELLEVERLVNGAILDGLPVEVKEMPIAEAKALGAEALFGEKYGDVVRVVSMGDSYSTELCGGTHLDNSAKVGTFIITAEYSVASGVRRIDASTGWATLAAMNLARHQLSKLSEFFRTGSHEETVERVHQAMQSVRDLRSKLDAAMTRESRSEAERMFEDAHNVNGFLVVTHLFEDTDADVEKLKLIEDTVRGLNTNVVAVLATAKDGKVTLIAGCGQKAIERGVKAGTLIREVSKICGGSGGGKPEFAMGGGRDAKKVREAFEFVDEYLSQWPAE